jgi:dUTP pyrophosphatase
MRATKNSAGYDFFMPHDLVIFPGRTEGFWTDVKALMPDFEFLGIIVRGSIGNKKNLMMGNTEGIVDADYYGNPENDGNIKIILRNLGDEPIKLAKGERVVQGIFQPYFPADNCNSENERTGGNGSTGTQEVK